MMFRRLIIISILLQVLILCAYSQNHHDDQLLRETVARYRQATVRIPLPEKNSFLELSRNVSINSVRGKYAEVGLSSLNVEWFISRNYDYSIIPEPDLKSLVSASTMAEAMEWTSYPTFTQYDSIMRSFVALYPSLCKLDTIGFSVYGKLVMALKISDNPKQDQDKPEVFYSSTIHGNETGGFVLMMRFAEYLLKNYATDQRVRNLVNSLEIWINPLANPDGTYLSGNTISSPIRYNANNINLNRNFPDPIERELPEQVETTDMIRFMRSHHFVLSANFHSGVEVVNYPWDRWRRRHPDDAWFHYISRKYADTVHIHAVAGYMTFRENGVTNGWDWYDIYGGRQDFVTWELQGREVTIELDDNYVTPAAQLNSLWEANYRSLLGYIENALYGIHGTVTDSVTGETVPAKIFISGHDADSSHVYSDTLTGGFTRLIAPGSWTLKLTADGYQTKTVNVTVEQEQMTWIDVKMTLRINPIDTVPTAGLFIYPNPANEFIKVVLPERQIGIVELRIFNSLGINIRLNSVNNIEHTTEDIPLNINVQDLPGGVYTIIIRNTATKVTDKASFVIVHRK